LFEESGGILVLDNLGNNIRRYLTGHYVGVFANVAASGMSSPKYMEFGPDGNIYVVGNGSLSDTIQMFDAGSGTPLGSFIIPGSGGLITGQGLLFHTDGKLYVSNGAGNSVLTYDAATGNFAGQFVSSGSGGLSNPHSLRFGPDGHLYVASRGTNSVKRYEGSSGNYMGDFVEPGSGSSPGTGSLVEPAGLLFCAAPGAVRDLTLAHDAGTGATTLSWNAPQKTGAPLLVFDTLGSSAADDFTGTGPGFCLESDDSADTSAIHAETPPAGEPLFFLVRAENVCGNGPLGPASAGSRTATDCVPES
jgi:WD40 repeat protein